MNVLNYENVKLFNPNFRIKDWCFNKILSPEEIDYYEFYNKEIEYTQKNVPIDKVVGTNHASYIGKIWISLIHNMKRFKDYYTSDNFIEFLETTPNSEAKKGWDYIKYGENYFVSGGNHRNCQAKFSDVKEVMTGVKEYILDKEMLDLYLKLVDMGLFPNISKSNDGKYYRFSTWKIQLNNEEYSFYGFSAIQKFINLYTDTSITFLDKIRLKYFLPKNIEKRYKDFDDYTLLKYPIMLYKMKNQID